MTLDKISILELFENNLNYYTPSLTTNLEESDQIEFKQSLHTHASTIDKQYIKPISGLANNKGGVMIYGVSPEKELKGIKESQENLDNSWFSSTVRQNLDGSIDYCFFTKRYLNKIIGFLVIQEAKSKPVIARFDAGDIKMGDIYFRYPAQLARISSGDLRAILMEEITKKTQRMLETFQRIVEVGNENISIINTKTGEIQSSEQDLKLFLNEAILNKLNLIKHGEFVSENGAPAYVIKGEIEVDSPNFIEKAVPLDISDNEILRTFFARECKYPETYIKKIITNYTLYQPIHYFIKLLGKSSGEASEYINSFQMSGIKSGTRNKLYRAAWPVSIHDDRCFIS